MMVVFEGIDGSGKGTQAERLSVRLSARGVDNQLYSFPNYKGTNFGLEIGKYLNGEFGDFDKILPQFPVMLYAMDRYEMKKNIVTDLKSDTVVIIDRYVSSNIAHQAVRFPENERSSFADWVKRLEYNILEVPKPDFTVFLDVPYDVAVKNILKKEKRSYTNQDLDMHEKNAEYMNSVYSMYKKLAIDEGWIIIDCVDNDTMLPEDEVTRKIVLELGSRGFPIDCERLI